MDVKPQATEMEIVMQVGSELRIKNNGEIVVDNPELELTEEEKAADAVLQYRFDPQSSEHILRLVKPIADRKHMRTHRPGD